ncbi:hypothetical protein CBR_g38541 [Chara braunii]|uniref:Proteasome subunit beta n=1 Tax=Chara braunii TaxID=69332 RepID=A0A388JP19_CHABU|nr:hypothetical protein CBR_g38541 [Chara braunii]|eukprot:GBG59517.1 hypothetical protein CBR_g38541 [Chara braunii]
MMSTSLSGQRGREQPSGAVALDSSAIPAMTLGTPIVAGGESSCSLQIMAGPATRTLDPYVVGSSVLGVKYKDGVLLAADTLGSYGSTLRFKSVERLRKVGKNTVVGASGEISDFVYIMSLLDELTTLDYCWGDGKELSPKEVHSYLNRVMYNRRNKFDPLWNAVIVAGVHGGESYLGVVNLIGVHYEDSHLATGFGNHLARPIFRAEHRVDMTEEEAIRLLEKSLRVLYYRDKQSINKYQLAKITAEGTQISKPFALTTEWSYTAFEDPAKVAVGTW